jgi:hypothetical protein
VWIGGGGPTTVTYPTCVARLRLSDRMYPILASKRPSIFSLGASEWSLAPRPCRDFRLQILTTDSMGVEASEQIARRSCLTLRETYLCHRQRLGDERTVEAVNEHFATAVTEHSGCWSSPSSRPPKIWRRNMVRPRLEYRSSGSANQHPITCAALTLLIRGDLERVGGVIVEDTGEVPGCG